MISQNHILGSVKTGLLIHHSFKFLLTHLYDALHPMDVKIVKGSFDWLSTCFTSGTYSDFVIVDSQKKKHTVHKLILALNSDFFQTNFKSGFLKEKETLSWQFEDKSNVLPEVENDTDRCEER